MKKIFITAEDYQILSSIMNPLPYDFIVFGSRIKGTHQEFSDLDLCLKSIIPISLSELASIKMALSESDLPFSVDVIDYQDISSSFKKLIDNDGVNFRDTTPVL